MLKHKGNRTILAIFLANYLNYDHSVCKECNAFFTWNWKIWCQLHLSSKICSLAAYHSRMTFGDDGAKSYGIRKIITNKLHINAAFSKNKQKEFLISIELIDCFFYLHFKNSPSLMISMSPTSAYRIFLNI